MPQARLPAHTTAHSLPTERAEAPAPLAGRSFAPLDMRQERRTSTSIYRAATNRTTQAPQDAFARWAALQAWSTDATNRLNEEADLDFWERIAPTYDLGALPTRVPAVLERVRALVPSGTSLLDVGAGTGAFTLPLAQTATRITALDYSPAMLRILRQKLADAAACNVRAVLARWEDAALEPHDVVLAANALYRTADLRLALRKMIELARRRGIVVWSVGRQDAPQQAVREQVRPEQYQAGPDYVHVLEGLYHLDVFAHVDLIATDDTQRYSNDAQATDGLLSWSPITADDQVRVASLLPHLLERDGVGWRWRRRGRIAVIWWDGPDANADAACRS